MWSNYAQSCTSPPQPLLPSLQILVKPREQRRICDLGLLCVEAVAAGTVGMRLTNWLARDIQHLLGYAEWRNFNK